MRYPLIFICIAKKCKKGFTCKWSNYELSNNNVSMTKYSTSVGYGIVDDKITLDPEDDVAHVKWGGNWRMPTKAEQDELRKNCTWESITQNGVYSWYSRYRYQGCSVRPVCE